MQNSFVRTRTLLVLSALALLSFTPRLGAEEFESKPADPFFEKFNAKKAPALGPLLLKTGDKLAIVGDSISDAFEKVDAAVAAKQAYETEQIKEVFHGPEGKKDMEAAATKTEAERAPLAAAIQTALVPVTHTIKIEAQ